MNRTDSEQAKSGPLPGGDWPFVSVVMPIRNEGRFIEKSLGAVLAQDYPADRMEVVVVDGQSDDDTREKVAALSKGPVRVTLHDNPKRIVPPAMNVGIRAAIGQIIVRVDGHTIIEPDYVRQSVLGLVRTGAHCVGGMQRAVPSTAYVSRAVAAATSSPFGVGGSVHHYLAEERRTDLVYLGVYPKWVLEHIGMYDEEFVRNQDDELDYRLLKVGGRIWLIPSVKSSYSPRSTLQKLAKQYFQYGWWKVRCYQKHAGHVRAGHLVPGAFTLAFVAGLALAPAWAVFGWLWALMMGLYLAGATAYGVKASKVFGWDLLPAMPLTFSVMHLSYGLGFLLGLVRFAGRWGESDEKIPPIPADEPAWSYRPTGRA